jgi:hypothetical protein
MSEGAEGEPERARGTLFSSLALYRESVAGKMPPDQQKEGSAVDGDQADERRCPNKLDFDMLNTGTGQIAPASCRANSCGHCGPNNARRVGGAITLAGPQRWGMLTQVGEDWQTIRPRMKRLRYSLQKCGIEHAWCWHVEPNPAGTGHHVHYFQRGAFVPQSLLSELADREGMGRVATVQRWRPTQAATTYGVKLAGVRYGLKLAEESDTMSGYLAANGGRLVHASRGFWRNREGEHVGQREAMKSWAQKPEESGEEWVLIRRVAS